MNEVVERVAKAIGDARPDGRHQASVREALEQFAGEYCWDLPYERGDPDADKKHAAIILELAARAAVEAVDAAGAEAPQSFQVVGNTFDVVVTPPPEGDAEAEQASR